MPALRGKVALVTGGARGLGAEVCRVLARHGADVVCADVREDLAEGLVQEIRGAEGQASTIALDVRDPQAVADAVGRLVRSHDRVDIVVNNAAIDITVAADELAVDDWRRIIDTNLNGPYWLCRSVFPVMKRQGGGQIVNIASTAAKRAWPNATGYHASKWGLLGLSHALHAEGRAHGIKVTAVVSGGMRTPFLLDRFPDIDVNTLQDPRHVADTILFVLTRPPETVIPEIMVLPMTETSWP
ncbi:short-chain dehydrogenase [Sulfurifustis variabilis]|uniref:Short-chain dehydrogenase n=1 Tax=Sulfurifustis variabilis TaxID=1675686 RepID=A0A1B4V6S1_9GAMM|nr:SDR family oxidoreductase [Sulfurifustis variabilis]BAU48282.1 short-chain dehydrogenase [Sulfurifustis variabilis]